MQFIETPFISGHKLSIEFLEDVSHISKYDLNPLSPVIQEGTALIRSDQIESINLVE